MEQGSPLRRLADTLIDDGLDRFVETRRASGRSWRLIARDLFDSTDGQVDVTDQTLRTWYGSEPAAVAS